VSSFGCSDLSADSGIIFEHLGARRLKGLPEDTDI
jgi:hypothetical protein